MLHHEELRNFQENLSIIWQPHISRQIPPPLPPPFCLPPSLIQQYWKSWTPNLHEGGSGSIQFSTSAKRKYIFKIKAKATKILKCIKTFVESKTIKSSQCFNVNNSFIHHWRILWSSYRKFEWNLNPHPQPLNSIRRAIPF